MNVVGKGSPVEAREIYFFALFAKKQFEGHGYELGKI